MIKLTDKITKEISKNLMLEISDEEAKLISSLIESSVEKIEKVKSIDLSNIEPMDYPDIIISNDFREDEVEEFDNVEELLDLAPEKENRFIKV
ncbi:MAG: Asp-tRNA(Asn)/Glu-tRNA(Gln) amidotransferase subunit GatC [Malacoplasma sp.]|nr:Asp-tRNA(Asn)/Glu-tRNA(Gln) amidotransferase subunit GatC [Malacoplasma sp.]MDE6646113.1 Asp-tRNA(Asn)/Glu-tRNA(Gln) amidotransferase subunit GatC [Malacoplasma sp.]MDE6894043.1 Asp-tRNA(Asn)/Glu-tRNA(Gln) amidotransferase subunit GatC [Malacoplasma sp.]MDE7075162.1 Asp-tRNA(Asn)/Glu-tRNA(Gln) amidotransferase subunit GatC [Malacoplasma sp.]MDE7088034.1 Asp-tRNA(Asn)/Glu-tRNA(Gln) amidotransferase subunit GatC [Malacoplasma sp.]